MRFGDYKSILMIVGILILIMVPLTLKSQSTSPKEDHVEHTQPIKLDSNQINSEQPDQAEIPIQPVSKTKTPYLRNERPGVTKFQEFKETVARQAAQYPDLYFLEALDYDQEVALTFDDGPDGVYTEQILDILKQYDVKATFFLLGSNIQRYPEVVKRIVAEGHAIGNHSYSHPDLRTLSKEDAYQAELSKTQQVFAELVSIKPAIYRPPYGAVTDEQILYFAEQGLLTINWSIDTFDWDKKQNSVEEMKQEKVFKYLHEGGIILMHSAGGNRENTVKALPGIIEGLQNQGYQLKTIPELLEISGQN